VFIQQSLSEVKVVLKCTVVCWHSLIPPKDQALQGQLPFIALASARVPRRAVKEGMGIATVSFFCYVNCFRLASEAPAVSVL
jgi:hypothetical protein